MISTYPRKKSRVLLALALILLGFAVLAMCKKADELGTLDKDTTLASVTHFVADKMDNLQQSITLGKNDWGSQILDHSDKVLVVINEQGVAINSGRE